MLNYNEKFIKDCKRLAQLWARMSEKNYLRGRCRVINIDVEWSGNVGLLITSGDFEGDVFERNSADFPLEKVATIGGVKVTMLISEKESEDIAK